MPKEKRVDSGSLRRKKFKNALNRSSNRKYTKKGNTLLKHKVPLLNHNTLNNNSSPHNNTSNPNNPSNQNNPSNPSNNTCSICLNEENVDHTTKCGHKFHMECINEWKKLNYHCPNCRQPLITFKENSNFELDYMRMLDCNLKFVNDVFEKNNISICTRCCKNNLGKCFAVVHASDKDGHFSEYCHDNAKCYLELLSIKKRDNEKIRVVHIYRNGKSKSMTRSDNEDELEDPSYTSLFGPWD